MNTVIDIKNQGSMILLLYEGALKFLEKAKEALTINGNNNRKNNHEVGDNIIKTQNILTELMVSLDMSKGEVANNLYRLYDYMNHRLIEANVKKDSNSIVEVSEMLRELRETWELAIRKLEKDLN
ncbi:flagellar export chaperone FliS [bacterium]|nr:flagellar export chaperone FliS [bacterium]MBU0900079.1 flagellar export chaperone FliS [bacterium]MBU1152743.1 flagellar export chaperone FliS [bacterium]MBU1782552.1 flagellar export chaperone FliS [bacterium]MBU2599087.1 flagellar export chaperone FliS [bacterium]